MTWIIESINVGSIKYIKVGDKLWDHIFAKSCRSYPYCCKQFSYNVKSTSHSNRISYSILKKFEIVITCTSTFLCSSMLLFGKKNKQWDTPFIKFMYYTTILSICYILKKGNITNFCICHITQNNFLWILDSECRKKLHILIQYPHR